MQLLINIGVKIEELYPPDQCAVSCCSCSQTVCSLMSDGFCAHQLQGYLRDLQTWNLDLFLTVIKILFSVYELSLSSNRTQRNMVKLAFIAETIEGVNVCKILGIMSQNHALIPCSSGSWAACILSVSCIWSSEPLPPLLTVLLGSVSDGGALGGQLAVD